MVESYKVVNMGMGDKRVGDLLNEAGRKRGDVAEIEENTPSLIEEINIQGGVVKWTVDELRMK